MLTGAPYEDVPDFVSETKSWSQALKAWLHSRGLTYARLGVDIAAVPDGSCSIEIGRTSAGTFHAVAVAGERYDPDPLERGFIEPAKHRLFILPLA